MKKLFASILLVFTILLSQQATVFAGSGSAVIPHYIYQRVWNTNFYLSNVTDATITVKIKLYKKDGSLITGGVAANILQGTNFATFTDDATNTYSILATIGAKDTANLRMENYSVSTDEYGFGEIEWSQDSDAIYGLVVTGRLYLYAYGTSQNYPYAISHLISVNDSKPF